LGGAYDACREQPSTCAHMRLTRSTCCAYASSRYHEEGAADCEEAGARGGPCCAYVLQCRDAYAEHVARCNAYAQRTASHMHSMSHVVTHMHSMSHINSMSHVVKHMQSMSYAERHMQSMSDAEHVLRHDTASSPHSTLHACVSIHGCVGLCHRITLYTHTTLYTHASACVYVCVCLGTLGYRW
jgi:hypothetical protein